MLVIFLAQWSRTTEATRRGGGGGSRDGRPNLLRDGQDEFAWRQVEIQDC